MTANNKLTSIRLSKSECNSKVMACFDFLISKYNFEVDKCSQSGRESIVTYLKQPVSISIVFVTGTLPEVMLKWADDTGSGYAFLHHLTRRFLSPKFPKIDIQMSSLPPSSYYDFFDLWLKIQCEYLTKHGRKFLDGDYSRIAENKKLFLSKFRNSRRNE